MDGVLADWDAKHKELFGCSGDVMRNSKMTKAERREYNDKLVNQYRMFENLEPMPLVEVLKQFPGMFKILSATGNKFPAEVAEQKRAWLKKQFGEALPDENIILVQRSVNKAVYAHKHSALIDDRMKAIEPYVEAGGMAMQFINHPGQIDDIKTILTQLVENDSIVMESLYNQPIEN
ncbi:5'-3' deoxyribonucleotidase [Vibrio phage EniLVp02]